MAVYELLFSPKGSWRMREKINSPDEERMMRI
jgi:hypothetical protein